MAFTIAEEDLYRLYVVEGKPMHRVADELGVAVGSVYNYIKRYGIKSREPHQGMKGKRQSEEVRKRIGDAHRGKVVSEESRRKMSESSKKGGVGHKKKRCDGYIAVYFPDHPNSNKEGYIMEHILVMEAILGRWVKEDEVVHHINKNREDNRKENLMLMTASEHISMHSKERWEKKRRNDLLTR